MKHEIIDTENKRFVKSKRITQLKTATCPKCDRTCMSMPVPTDSLHMWKCAYCGYEC